MKGKKTGGRKKGAANKKTRAIADKAAAEGLTPLEVLLKEMRWCAQKVEEERAKESPDISALVLLVGELRNLAKDAAPYVHPRLQSTTVKGEGKDGEIPLSLTVKFVG